MKSKKMKSKNGGNNHLESIAVPLGLILAKESIESINKKKTKSKINSKNKPKPTKKNTVKRIRRTAVGGMAPIGDLTDSNHVKNLLSDANSASKYTGLEGGFWSFNKKSNVTPTQQQVTNSQNTNSTKTVTNSQNTNSTKTITNSQNTSNHESNNDSVNDSKTNQIAGNKTKSSRTTYYNYWIRKELQKLSVNQPNIANNEKLPLLRAKWKKYKEMTQFEKNKKKFNKDYGLINIQNAGSKKGCKKCRKPINN
jgi:hypothetical protein